MLNHFDWSINGTGHGQTKHAKQQTTKQSLSSHFLLFSIDSAEEVDRDTSRERHTKYEYTLFVLNNAERKRLQGRREETRQNG